MTENNATPDNNLPASGAVSPEIRPYRPTRWSWIWLVPLVAGLVGLSLVVRTWMHIGPTITIQFESAEGLEIGQTKVRYKDIIVGQVTDLAVSDDRSSVIVSVQLERDGADFITQDGTRFWVVRPRLGISGVSGLGTLLSGAYIAVDTPSKVVKDDMVYHFTGLEAPPEVTSGRPGTRFTITASDLGSLDIGSPVYYRRIPVGQVIGYALAPDGRSVNVQIFIDAPNDRFVTAAARFWNASGIHVNLSTNGLDVQTESVVSMLAGGIAFETSDPSVTSPALKDTHFPLFESRQKALAEPDGDPFMIEFHFPQSVRGLKIGAPVDFRGLELGEVADIDLEYDKEHRRFYALVKARLYPLRFGRVYETLMSGRSDIDYPGADLLGPLIKHGLRGQLRAANLLTGQQYVALEFFPDEPAAVVDVRRIPLVVPTIPGNFDKLQQQISSIVTKVEGIPFDGIGKDLRESLASMNDLIKNLDENLTPQATRMLKKIEDSMRRIDALIAKDSPVNSNLESALQEISRASRSLRSLTDYLQANPSSVIRGQAPETFKVTP